MAATNLSAFIWSVADLLRGDFKQADYGKVILPFTILRRLDCALDATKDAALAEHRKRTEEGFDSDSFVKLVTGYSFYNTSKLDFGKLLADPSNVKQHLLSYLFGFSPNVADIFEKYEFEKQIDRLASSKLLYLVIQKFAEVDLHPNQVSNSDMGMVFEELIRKFAELSNETAGEHFTPREVIRLMVNLLFLEDSDALTKPGKILTLYDPTAGTGGMLSVAEEYLKRFNPDAQLVVSGQELNPESYAICKGDMLIKGQDVSKIAFGNTLSEDAHVGEKFSYGLSNPPFGVEWKKVQKEVEFEQSRQGFNGRFGPGLPRVSDGSLLFLLHLISKMRPTKTTNSVIEGGGRIAIVLNGSPLFTGGAGSGESDIRKWILENDLLEAIVALPTDMFYNTGISTYIWVLCNHKTVKRRGKVQLINGVEFFQKMRKSLGSKRKELGEPDIDKITKLYGDFEETEYSKIFDNREFGYSTITVERPLKLSFQVPEAGMPDDETSVEYRQPLFPAINEALRKQFGDKKWMSRKQFLEDAAKATKGAAIDVTAQQWKALVSELGERDDDAEICCDSKGRPEADSTLRDTENVPLKDDIRGYFEREVLPHLPDAWIDESKTKVGYEIPFTRHFYKFVQPRSLEEIDADLKLVTQEIMSLLSEVTHAQ
jgi:type I restriction enzyme M protein